MQGFFWEGDINSYYLGHQFEEIFKSRIYAPYMEGKSDITVIDCGANIGVFTIYAQKYSKKVYSIEPAKEHFFNLSHMIEFNAYSNVTAFNIAFGNYDGEGTFYHDANKTMFSLTPNQKTDDTEKVQVMRLDTFFQKNNIEHIDVFKIDTEGEEYNIICGDGFANVANKIDLVIGETHVWANRNPSQLKDAFRMNGFSFEVIPGEAALFVAKRK